jgi:hypothetical protein
MALHPTTFEYLKPTDEQIRTMAQLRSLTANYMRDVDRLVPEGPDKTYILRKLREVGMWENVAITRHPDGSPRVDDRRAGSQ